MQGVQCVLRRSMLSKSSISSLSYPKSGIIAKYDGKIEQHTDEAAPLDVDGTYSNSALSLLNLTMGNNTAMQPVLN